MEPPCLDRALLLAAVLCALLPCPCLLPGRLASARVVPIRNGATVDTSASSHDTRLTRSPEERLDDLVLPYGYPLEAHDLQTQDGYLLSVVRIPASTQRRQGDDPQRQPVLLQHGLLDSCAGFLLNGPQQSLAFILADAGRLTY